MEAAAYLRSCLARVFGANWWAKNKGRGSARSCGSMNFIDKPEALELVGALLGVASAIITLLVVLLRLASPSPVADAKPTPMDGRLPGLSTPEISGMGSTEARPG